MKLRRTLAMSAVVALALTAASVLLPGRDRRNIVDSSLSATSIGSVRYAKERVRLNPADATAHALLGLAYLNKVKSDADPGFYPKAEASLDRALALDPQNFESLFGQANTALGRHDFIGGLDWARKARGVNTYNSDALGAIGDGLLESGRYTAAGRAFQRMVDLRPGLPAFARISYLRELRGDTQGAIQAMRLAVRSAGTPDDAAWCYFQIGDLWLNSGHPERARAVFRMASRLAPGTATALNGLAKMAAAEGRLPAAINRMERVIELNREPGYAIFIGDLYTANYQSKKASWAYRLAADLEAAEEANGVNVNLESSLFAADHGEPAEALARAQTEYSSRRSIHVADAYAWALYSNGRFIQAKRLSREAFRLGTKSPLFFFHAGMIDLALGREKRAAAELRTALELNPRFSLIHAPTARKALVRLAQKG